MQPRGRFLAERIKQILEAEYKVANIQLGFLDGKIGWQICTKSSYATYLKYKSLRDLWKSKIS